MRPITAKDIDRYPYLYLFDDEPLINLVVEFDQAEHAQEWWYVVVDLEDGFALAKVSDFTQLLANADTDILNEPLGSFVGDMLIPISVTYELADADMNVLREEAFSSDAKAAIILEDGDFRGVIPVGGTRSSGVFDSGLVAMAGKYGEIPKEGVLSPRRKNSKKSKKK